MSWVTEAIKQTVPFGTTAQEAGIALLLTSDKFKRTFEDILEPFEITGMGVLAEPQAKVYGGVPPITSACAARVEPVPAALTVTAGGPIGPPGKVAGM